MADGDAVTQDDTTTTQGGDKVAWLQKLGVSNLPGGSTNG